MDLDANMNEPEAGSKQRRPWNREEVTVQSHSGHDHTAARGFHPDPQQAAEASIHSSVALTSRGRAEQDETNTKCVVWNENQFRSVSIRL